MQIESGGMIPAGALAALDVDPLPTSPTHRRTALPQFVRHQHDLFAFGRRFLVKSVRARSDVEPLDLLAVTNSALRAPCLGVVTFARQS